VILKADCRESWISDTLFQVGTQLHWQRSLIRASYTSTPSSIQRESTQRRKRGSSNVRQVLLKRIVILAVAIESETKVKMYDTLEFIE
jgi:hypothetical protein